MDADDSNSSGKTSAVRPNTGTDLPEPVRSLFEAADQLAFRDKSCYTGDPEEERFVPAFVSVSWDGFSALARYCAENKKELRLEYLPLMNMFEVGKCRRVRQSETADGGWTYDFFWNPNNGQGEEQILLTVKLSETGITAEQGELADPTLSSKKALHILEYLRLGVLRWSFTDAGTSAEEENPGDFAAVIPLFTPAEFADTFEPSPQPISVGDRLKKQGVLPDLNFDAHTEMKIVLTSCAGLQAEIGKGTTSFSIPDGPLNYKTTFAVAPTPKNADDRQILTIALINDMPADKVVEQVFLHCGIIEEVEAKIIEKELAIEALEGSYAAVPMISSSDPKEQQQLFSQRKRLEKKNRNIDTRIRNLSTQIARDRKSLDVELNKRLKRNLKFFQKKFAVTYEVYLTNSTIGRGEFLLCDTFSDSGGSRIGEDLDAGEGNGLEEDAEIEIDGGSEDDLPDFDEENPDGSGGNLSEEDEPDAAEAAGRSAKTKHRGKSRKTY